MAARSRRSTTMASSMATQDLARQRTEMQTEAATWHATGKRPASHRKHERELKPRKTRRPRRWVPPGWDGNRWSARSIHPGGLETHHEPCMSSFLSTEVMSSSADNTCRYAGRLSWLRPRNSVSIWEHFADVKRRATTAPALGVMVARNASLAALANAPTTLDRCDVSARTVGADAGCEPPATLGGAVGDGGCQMPSFAAATKASERPVWLARSTRMRPVIAKSSEPAAESSCASSSSATGAADLDVSAPKTPAVAFSADRVSIMSLVNGP
jgi:hypothetical protein